MTEVMTLEDKEKFVAFKKIPRLFREVIITEKIDGTNASILITEDGRIKAGKRTSWITPQADNFGFAKWVEANKDELLKMGPGRYYGEWYGAGIQRTYGLQEKRFALFRYPEVYKPECVQVVPVLYTGPFNTGTVQHVLTDLAIKGSTLVPGFMKPEGIIIFHAASGQLFKSTIENDEKPKGVGNDN